MPMKYTHRLISPVGNGFNKALTHLSIRQETKSHLHRAFLRIASRGYKAKREFLTEMPFNASEQENANVHFKDLKG